MLGGEPTGLSEDPCLPGLIAPTTDRAGAQNLAPHCQGDGPMGLGPQTMGVDVGPVDYFGSRVPKALKAGAAQTRPAD